MERDSHFGKYGDMMIIGILVLALAICNISIFFLINNSDTRIFFITLSTLIFGSLGFITVFWGSFIESKLLVEREIITSSKKLKSPLTIIHFSDLHAGVFTTKDFFRRVVDRVNKHNPDIIFITGDFVTNRDKHLKLLDPLNNLKSKLGTIAVLGNHDYGLCGNNRKIIEGLSDKVSNKLNKMGVKILKDEAKTLKQKDNHLTITGLVDLWARGKKPLPFLKDVSKSDFSILLCHNPDIIQEPEIRNYDLILCGHTHGGEIRLPFIGPIINLPTKISNSFDKGLFPLKNGAKLFITSGLGTFGTRARLFNPPEIVKITIKPIPKDSK